MGGLLALVLYVRRSSGALSVAVPRFSALALWCYIAIGISGLVNAWVRLGGVDALWSSRYGLLVVGKVAAFVALGVFGWWHRRRAQSFLRLAAGEVVVMAATIGLAVALSRTRTPVPDVPATDVSAAESVLGFDLPPYSLIEVLTGWRPDMIVLLVVGTCPVALSRRRASAVSTRRPLAGRANAGVDRWTRRRRVRPQQRARGVRPSAVQRAHAAAHDADDDRAHPARHGSADHAGAACLASIRQPVRAALENGCS